MSVDIIGLLLARTRGVREREVGSFWLWCCPEEYGLELENEGRERDGGGEEADGGALPFPLLSGEGTLKENIPFLPPVALFVGGGGPLYMLRVCVREIYIYREREREREENKFNSNAPFGMSLSFY